MKKIAFLVCFFLVLPIGWSQTKQEMDSLKQLLEATDGMEEAVRLNEELFVAYLYSSPDSANHYRENIKIISEENNYVNGKYLYYSLSGRYHYAKSNIDSAYTNIETASKIAEQLQNKSYLADCYKKMGVIHNIRGNDSLAKEYGLLALDNAKRTDDWRTLSSIYVLLGNRSFQRASYPEALIYYLKLDSIYTSQDDLDKSLAAAYTNIGMIYSELRDSRAIDYINKSIEVYRTLGLEEGVHYGEVALGTYYDLQNEKKKAIVHLLKAEEYYEGYGDLRILGGIYRRLGSAYLNLNDLKNAEFYLLKASSIPEKSSDQTAIAALEANLGDLYVHKKEYDKAISHFKRAIEVLDELNDKRPLGIEYLNTYRGLYEAYRSNKEYENGLVVLEKLVELESEVQKSQNQLEVEELNKKYQTDKQQQEIELLTSQTELAKQKSKNQRNLFIGGMSVMGLALISLFFLFKNKQKTNRRLKELEAAKSKFFANISHEFRTPLTLISGPVAHQLSKDSLSTDDKTDLGLIQRNADRLLNLVNQLLDLSKIEAGHRKLMVSKGDLKLFLGYLIEPFQYQAEQKGMSLEHDVQISGETWFDKEIVEKVVANLLSNAIKYSKKGGQIRFELRQEGTKVKMELTNESSNITEKDLPKLFDRFYQNSSLNPGVGIGLSLIKELVQLCGGTLRASKPNKATVLFQVLLPVTKGAFAKEDLVATDESGENYPQFLENTILEKDPEADDFMDSDLPLLLVIDDNAEICLFIKNLFKKEYRIIEAENGEEGINKALKTIPDMIISDIMMPVKDGIHLSHVLKNDERTSHIPIILLTAKSGEENELKGLKAGADSYMVKPFREEKLRLVMERLLATRESIREKLDKQVILKPQEVELTDADSQLLNRIKQVLDQNLTDPQFNAQSFCEQVGLSRMHLHRKLKALTGRSTSEFLRLHRLKSAAKLLEHGEANIAEVGYAVGFNQPAYFSTAFKQHFGCSPSAYVKKSESVL